MAAKLDFIAILLVCLSYVSCESQPNSVENHTNAHWSFNYKDLQAWTAHYSTCSGHHQSPIDIEDNASLVVLKNVYPKLTISGYDHKLSEINVTNNGHTVVATVSEGMSVSGGPLGDSVYQFVQLHFHWGSKDSVGSEHRLYNKTFPIECHFVHFNRKYKILDQAMNHEDGLLVIAVFGKLSDENNTALQPISDSLDRIELSPSMARVVSDHIEPMEDLFPSNHNTYYHYNGSLTTPTCHESVLWILFPEPIQISEYQLNEFRGLRQGDEDHLILADNFRPLQPLNGRMVEFVESFASKFKATTFIVIVSLFSALMANRL